MLNSLYNCLYTSTNMRWRYALVGRMKVCACFPILLSLFFPHENQSCSPFLSNMGNLRLGGKSDLLPFFSGIYQQQNLKH